ncbi:GIY-YIG nuclease family protein [Tsuneonella flava]|uniref:GIY-YIG nuclease family protein n=1 Tax=Tsuneonella flava TaxID=2055955 RepID=A0ABX7KDV1_9SPHN|nr:GIY-YIG nuclease family protein [Tsuneonella flava]QSB45401.1 GIY-YIG nuclease family protein [Tsuneonella flava]
MDREKRGVWVYMMANRYRGTIYIGVTSDLPRRIHQHIAGNGSNFCARYGLTRLVWAECGEDIATCIAHEKRIKHWRREWKFALVEKGNPGWEDLSGWLV